LRSNFRSLRKSVFSFSHSPLITLTPSSIVGKGAYVSVHRGIHIPTGDVALKIINLDTPDDDVEDIQREVALLSQLRGSGNDITKYYGCYLDGPRVWIVMDFASGGSVQTLMKATKANVI
jgi:serine/threonine protein kinase